VKALSLFSGAGGMDLGLDRAGITAVAHCEIDPKAQSVLRRHWPDVPVISDVREVTSDVGRVDLVHGGFPCQDISVAGNRAGLAGDRSGLWWEFHRILGELRPRWCVIENVAGLLSSNGGRDLGAILGALGELGYGYAYRVLDARHFGVPQRRRRVFIVGHLGGRGAAEVLLEPEGVRRDPAPGREAGQEVAGTLGGGSGSRGWAQDTDRMTFVPVPQHTGTVTCAWAKGPSNTNVQSGHVVPVINRPTVEVVGTFSQGAHPGGFNGQDAYTGHAIPVSVAENQRGEVYLSDYMQALTGGGNKPGQGYAAVLAFDSNFGGQSNVFHDHTPPVKVGSSAGISSPPAVMEPGSLAVRRLTPRECERLMGWPDDWTRWADDGAEIADSHRYRMCGNGVVAPVAEWIGRRIVEVEQ
jgi:DNA (cytosine-5)-methyltransferase 1